MSQWLRNPYQWWSGSQSAVSTAASAISVGPIQRDGGLAAGDDVADSSIRLLCLICLVSETAGSYPGNASDGVAQLVRERLWPLSLRPAVCMRDGERDDEPGFRALERYSYRLALAGGSESDRQSASGPVQTRPC